MNLRELYKSFSSDPDCRELLLQTHWLSSFVEFDPRTGETLPMPLSIALDRMARRTPSPFVKDRLWHLMSHSEEAARRLMTALSEEPRREPAYLPIRQVRELDTASFIALSRRPGRNIREKLADKPYMQAVRHFQSIDIPENRLLKAYLMQLADALELRKEYLKDKGVEDYLQAIYRWLKEDEVQTISRWENLAPNNALLSHRDYRRVWDSWRLLQSLDADIERDMVDLVRRRYIKDKWEKLAKQYAVGNVVFADMPLIIDYNTFDITPWDPDLPSAQVKTFVRDTNFFKTNEPVCLDLTQLQPVFATPSQVGKLHDVFFWQRWRSERELVDLELFGSDAIYLHANATTITSSDMFFSKGDASEALVQAAHSFIQRLGRHFHNGRLIWLTPDGLNDFDLDLARKNINAAFSQADPLPCSVAAVFEHIGYEEIAHDGYRVAVVERINSKAYLTEMIARRDEELLEVLPETRGYIWEKGVTELSSDDVPADDVKGPVYLYKEGDWSLKCNPYGVAHTSDRDVVEDDQDYDRIIRLNTRPVSGGIRLYQLQMKAGDIPLWRNHIPELMTKVMLNGSYQSFYFVGKDVTVQPIRNKPIRIPVPQKFTLPKGKRAYRLPLLLGTNEEALEYEAKLASKDFPYAEDVECRLNMTYTYGADDPYKLVFEPLDKRYRPVSVVWQPREFVVVDDAPAPGFPEATSWAELQNHWNPKRQDYSNLLAWSLRSTRRLLEMLDYSVTQPVEARMKTSWKVNFKGDKYAFARDIDADYYINEHCLLRDIEIDSIREDDLLFFFCTVKDGRTWVNYAAPAATVHEYKSLYYREIKRFIRSSMYVPFIKIWANGQSMNDDLCPDDYRRNMRTISTRFLRLSEDTRIPESIRIELLFLLCCMGKDMPEGTGELISDKTANRKLRAKALGFALGDLSAEWQKYALRAILSNCDNWALQALSAAAWRRAGFIPALQQHESLTIIQSLHVELDRSSDKIIRKSSLANEDAEIGQIVKLLELLLAMLRTRESDEMEIKMLLQPGQDYTISFEEIVSKLIANACEKQYAYASRLQIEVSTKPVDDTTPDLLYALQLYLSGDDAGGAIRVTGVIDDES